MRHYLPLLALLALASCSDWNDDGTETIPSDPAETAAEPQEGIAFTANVVASQQATRANASLINRLETEMPVTTERTYYTMDSEDNVKAVKATYSVGLFGCYTATYSWGALQTLAAATEYNAGTFTPYPELSEFASLTASTTPTFATRKAEVLDAHYTANLMFNLKADVEAGGLLSYSPLRFWPNRKNGSQYDYATFWAYYPYNESVSSGSIGDYGISVVPDDGGVQTATGMGKMTYTMSRDASEHSDFLISDLQPDCSKDQYPLLDKGEPSRVPLRFHHMLAQVRLYAWITGTDKMVYAKSDGGLTWRVKTIDAANNQIILSDMEASDTTKTLTDLADYKDDSGKFYYVDNFGNTQELKVNDSIPDDTPWLWIGVASPKIKTQRWVRTDNPDQDGNQTAAGRLTMSFNNIRTSAVFTPTYDPATGKTTFPYANQGGLGSTTVNHYIQNPYWFRFDENKRRVMLNDTYMYDYFEDTPAAKGETSTGNIDGIDWYGKGTNCLGYDIDESDGHSGKELIDHKGSAKHYNYAPGNIILAVPQVMSDNNVPNISITAHGTLATYTWDSTNKKYTMTTGASASGKVTINMLNMAIKWESGFIYCYAYVDELSPGDDKVRGPESITVVFDPTKQTDQW